MALCRPLLCTSTWFSWCCSTTIVWRSHLPLRDGVRDWPLTPADEKEIEEFFEAAPPHESEKLETETYRVASWLQDRAKALLAPRRSASEAAIEAPEDEEAAVDVVDADELDAETAGPVAAQLKRHDVVALMLSSSGAFAERFTLGDLAQERKGNLKTDFEKALTGKLLIVDARLHGLKDGVLDSQFDDTPPTADDADADNWLPALPDGSPGIRFRVYPPGADEPVTSGASELYAFATKRSEEGEDTERLYVETWTTADSRSASSRPQLLAEHQSWTERKALAIADAVGLVGDDRRALGIAARLHDEGKRAKSWQDAFRAPHDGIYAKTKGPLWRARLDHYRHEFGSLPYVEKHPGFGALPCDLRDLVLHLVAAHHGFARPVIETRGCEDAPPSALAARACDVTLRFARLQKRWGPWGLAWWEALLRAADAQASRDNDEGRQPPETEKA